CATKCANGQICGADGDCTSGHCSSGSCVECVLPADCSGTDNDCQHRTCDNHVCGMFHEQNGTPTPPSTQTIGNCHTPPCDGMGGVTNAVDDADVPVDDNNQCTGEVCSSDVPSHPNLTDTTCNQSGGHVCSNAGDGTCVECNDAATCNGADNLCQTRACNN